MSRIWQVYAQPLGFPGTASNPVGFAAAPAKFGVGAYPGFLTGASGPNTTWQNGLADYADSLGTIPNGTAGNPTVIAYKDFEAFPILDQNEMTVDGRNSHAGLQYVTFHGCRFQCSNGASAHAYNVNCSQGSPLPNNLTFSYCSMTPRTALWPSLPITGWPSASAGTGVRWSSGDTPYYIPFNDGFEFAIITFTPAGGVMLVDHCDMWGWGDAWGGSGQTSFGQTIFTDNWMHDCRNPNGAVDHTDGLITGSYGFSNAIIRHNTIASLGNTNAIGMQLIAQPYSGATSYFLHNVVGASNNFLYWLVVAGPVSGDNPVGSVTGNWQQIGINGYDNVSIVNNYFSGFNNQTDIGTQCPIMTNLTYTDNIHATDLPWVANPLYADSTTQFTGTSNKWRRNTIRVYPGDTWTGPLVGATPIATQNGYFLYPAKTPNILSTTDFSG